MRWGADAEHLRTEHLVQRLGERAVSGGIATAGAQGAKFLLNFAAAAVLARLLSPEEFGLVGMVLAVTGLVGLFKEAGLSTATIQRDTITQAQVSNLFWINVALGGFAGLVAVCLAPVVAWFYRDSRLTAVMLALSVSFLLGGATVQHQALLMRQMRLTAMAIIELASMLAGIVLACGLALLGWTYWSLVAQQLCVTATALALTWWTSGWRPARPARGTGLAPLLTFGAHITVSDLIARTAVSSDGILVGRMFGAESLGLYSRASILVARPLEQLLAPLSAILIPVLSRLQSDEERYRRTFIRVYDALALITFPFAALGLALAEPVVLIVLGPKWKGVIPLFAGFTLVAVSLPLSMPAIYLFMSQGRGRDVLRTYSVLSFVTVAAFVAGLPWGPLGIVLALAVASLMIRLPILYYLAGRRGPVSTSDLWRGFLAHLPCWVAVYVAATAAHSIVGQAAPLVQLLVCVPVGLVGGAAAILILQRPRASVLYTWRTVRHSVTTQWRSAV